MATKQPCPLCGSDIPASAPGGLCPKCLMKQVASASEGAAVSPPLLEGPGSRIGRYELVELIGEGGMGLVYRAEQHEPVRRRVALKIIKPGMDSRQVIARFEAERQTLAMLEHPNIAQVFDAGTTDTGRPYFVMEHVEGLSITKYCDEHKLSIEERLALFQQVCEGVHHAHQKGIIHRDLKPSNVLVSVHGDRAVPKIIDFGVAKAVTAPLDGATAMTRQGQLLGTPEYMSPEQVNLASVDIDTRSDIYSLGVLLYELLAGVLPFDRESFKNAGLAQIQRTIQEEDPTPPSTRLTTLGDKAERIAERRRTQLITLARCLHRELEWIPMKAIRKDRTRRYRSASELADDIQNYLSGMPLIAGPESSVYRTRKFMRKHAGSVAMAVLVAVAIVIGLAVSTAMGFKAEQARAVAEEQNEEYRRLLYVHRVALADASYRDGNIERARELLKACPEDLRGWEWARLDYVSQDESMMTLRGHAGEVFGLAISPDGKRIASGSQDGTVKVWDAASGRELMTLQGHEGRVWPVSFSPDSDRIASGGVDNTVRVYDANDGTELMTLKGHEGEIRSITFSPDGRRIASADTAAEGVIKIWDASTGADLMTLRGERTAILDIAYSPDGTRIVSSHRDTTIKLWDAATGADLMRLRGHKAAVYSVAFSPDGKRIASGGYDGTIKLWDAMKGSELMTMRGHNFFVFSVSFSPDGRQLVSGGRDGTVKIWNTRSGEEVMTLHGHERPVFSIAFTPDGKRICSSSADKTIKIWDAIADREQTILGSHHLGVHPVAFSPDGTRIVSGGGPNGEVIEVWDVATGAQLMTLDGHSGKYIVSVSMSPDGKNIVSGGNDNTVRIWDAKTGAELKSLRGHDGAVSSASFSPDAKYIVSGSFDKTIKVWNAADGTQVRTFRGHDGGVRSVGFSPGGAQIVSGGRDGAIKVWDLETGTELMTLSGHDGGIQEVVFSPDGTRIVSGSLDKTVKIWDAKTGDELLTLRGHENPVYAIATSPDGKRIVSGGHFGMVKVWDASTGAEVMTLRRPGFGIAFSPDAEVLAAATGSGIVLWESQLPPDGYESRRAGVIAERLVAILHEEQGFYSKVLDKLKANETIEEPVRKLALQIAHARLWEDKEKEEAGK